MSRDFISELLDLKASIDRSIGLMLSNYKVANVSTFFIYSDISDYDTEVGDVNDQSEFFNALDVYMEAIHDIDHGPLTNARLVAALTNGQEIILHQVGDFDPEPDPDNEKGHRDWIVRQGAEWPDE